MQGRPRPSQSVGSWGNLDGSSQRRGYAVRSCLIASQMESLRKLDKKEWLGMFHERVPRKDGFFRTLPTPENNHLISLESPRLDENHTVLAKTNAFERNHRVSIRGASGHLVFLLRIKVALRQRADSVRRDTAKPRPALWKCLRGERTELSTVERTS